MSHAISKQLYIYVSIFELYLEVYLAHMCCYLMPTSRIASHMLVFTSMSQCWALGSLALNQFSVCDKPPKLGRYQYLLHILRFDESQEFVIMVPKLRDRYKNVIHARTLLIRQHFSLLFCKNLLISCSTCRAFISHAHILYIVKNYIVRALKVELVT